MRHFGSFVTESSEHFAEYVPWFIKAARPDLIERFDIPLDEYPRRCERQIAEWEALRARIDRDGAAALEPQASVEYGAHIIRACETGEPFAFNGNVPNRHAGGPLIDNLPDDCCVEVPCVAGADGVVPRAVGALPRHLAALMQTNVNVQGLTVEAALTGHREAVLPRRDARPAHRRRAAARGDPRPRRRPARGPRRTDPAARDGPRRSRLPRGLDARECAQPHHGAAVARRG